MSSTSEAVPNAARRILIVDDSPAIHDDYRRVLCGDQKEASSLKSTKALLLGDDAPAEKQNLNVDVVSAYQGMEAVELVCQSVRQDNPFRMAFVDVRMPPGMDGIETVSRIWEFDPHIQIVICTAFSDYSCELMSEKLKRPDQFLILKKPFDIAVVRQMTWSLLAKYELDQQVQLQIAEMARETKYTRAIIESSNDAYLKISDDARILDWGSKAEQLFGWSSEAIRGKHLNTILEFDADAGEPLADWLRHLAAESVGQRREMVATRRDGVELPVEVSISSVDLDGAKFFNAFIHDITPRRTLQAQLAHAQKMESVGRLAAGIAHEINTPTQFVADNLRFLIDAFHDVDKVLACYGELRQAAAADTLPREALVNTESLIANTDVAYLLEEIPLALQQSLEGVDRIASIVRSMKAFSHPGHDDKSDTDIHQAVLSAVTISRNEWRFVADVETDFDRDMPLINCQANELIQVFLNLIVNAAHAIRDSINTEAGELGKITISTQVLPDWAELRFSDTGGGIAEEDRDNVFDAFFTTKEVGRGSGQGLAIAHAIIAKGRGGKIEFESQPGEGTTFLIRLPIPQTAERQHAEVAQATV